MLNFIKITFTSYNFLLCVLFCLKMEVCRIERALHSSSFFFFHLITAGLFLLARASKV